MKNRTQLIIVMLVVSLFIAGSAFCEDGACQSGHDKAFHKDKQEAVTRELNLTPEQDKLLKEAKVACRAQMAELGKTLKAKRQALKDVLAKPGATRQQAEPIASEIKGLQSQMVDRRIDGILKVKAPLTPEQFQKLQRKHEGWQKGGRMKHEKKEW